MALLPYKEISAPKLTDAIKAYGEGTDKINEGVAFFKSIADDIKKNQKEDFEANRKSATGAEIARLNSFGSLDELNTAIFNGEFSADEIYKRNQLADVNEIASSINDARYKTGQNEKTGFELSNIKLSDDKAKALEAYMRGDKSVLNSMVANAKDGDDFTDVLAKAYQIESDKRDYALKQASLAQQRAGSSASALKAKEQAIFNSQVTWVHNTIDNIVQELGGFQGNEEVILSRLRKMGGNELNSMALQKGFTEYADFSNSGVPRTDASKEEIAVNEVVAKQRSKEELQDNVGLKALAMNESTKKASSTFTESFGLPEEEQASTLESLFPTSWTPRIFGGDTATGNLNKIMESGYDPETIGALSAVLKNEGKLLNDYKNVKEAVEANRTAIDSILEVDIEKARLEAATINEIRNFKNEKNKEDAILNWNSK